MTRLTRRLGIILSLITLCTTTTWAHEKPAAQPVSGKIGWVFGYEEGKALSRQTGKPMFVVFRCER